MDNFPPDKFVWQEYARQVNKYFSAKLGLKCCPCFGNPYCILHVLHFTCAYMVNQVRMSSRLAEPEKPLPLLCFVKLAGVTENERFLLGFITVSWSAAGQ